uniref:EF-hand domain-containing protein n=1 Tax=Cyprinus carpio carpio TaxID=630221 RepID=A0A8C1ECZ0_CYPCA
RARNVTMNRKLIQNLTDTLCKQVEHFDKRETECLIRLFSGLLEGRQREENKLHNTFGVTEDMMMDSGTFLIWMRTVINLVVRSEMLKSWVHGLETPQILIPLRTCGQSSICFDVYNLHTTEEMLQMLKDNLKRQPTEEDPDEGNKDIVEIALKKMDYDHDGRVSYSDFEKTVKVNFLLEAFGNSLPDAKSILAFEQHAFQELHGH